MRLFYRFDEINSKTLGEFAESVVKQMLKEAGCKFWKIDKEFTQILTNREIPENVRYVLEMLRDEDVRITILGRTVTLEEVLRDPLLSEEEKERLKSKFEIKVKKGTPDFLVYNPALPERLAWKLVEVKFGWSDLTTEQRRLLEELSKYIPCEIYRVIILEQGVQIAVQPVTMHRVVGVSNANSKSVGRNSQEVDRDKSGTGEATKGSNDIR